MGPFLLLFDYFALDPGFFIQGEELDIGSHYLTAEERMRPLVD